MTQALFGSVTPGWTGMSPGYMWPAFGTPFGGAESSPMAGQVPMGGYIPTGGQGQFSQPMPSWGNSSAGVPMAPVPLGTPFVVPGGITAPALMAAIAMRRGQPNGPGSDQDVEELLYDAIELLPSAGEVEVRCEGGRVSLTGSVPHKRVKRDVGELAWAIPGINDVNNSIAIATRRRARAFAREPDVQPTGPRTKQA
jgi:hypothetical protein